jgi:hypothetical protein
MERVTKNKKNTVALRTAKTNMSDYYFTWDLYRYKHGRAMPNEIIITYYYYQKTYSRLGKRFPSSKKMKGKSVPVIGHEGP